VAELVLRALDYRFSPIVFVLPENAGDYRPFHMGTIDPRVSSRDPLTVFDPVLLWKPNPAASRQLTPDGWRGEPLPAAPAPGSLVLLAVGDSNTLGSLRERDHWPGFVEDIARLNHPGSAVHVVNAGVYGYTSFQGVRRLREMLPLRPAVAWISFGANDAQPVRTRDRVYADRLDSLRQHGRFRLLAPAAHAWWSVADAVRSRATPRVPLDEYRRNLVEMVELARGQGTLPVLLTRPYLDTTVQPGSWAAEAPAYAEVTREVGRATDTAVVDAWAEFRVAAEAFVDPSHFNRVGNRRLAELLVSDLAERGVLPSARLHENASAIDLRTADNRRLELGPGWHEREEGLRGAGRWTAARATLVLRRTHAERGLALEMTCAHPSGLTRGTLAVNGGRATAFEGRDGLCAQTLDLGAVEGPDVQVEIAAEAPYRPADRDPRSRDVRTLGVFVHAARLVDGRWPAVLDLGESQEAVADVARGFWGRETWAEGRAGRWTRERAQLTLGRYHDEKALLLEWSFHHPGGRTPVRVEVNGRVVAERAEPEGTRLTLVPLGTLSGERVAVALVAPEAFADKAGRRRLGLFLHSARLVRGELAPEGLVSSLRVAPAGPADGETGARLLLQRGSAGEPIQLDLSAEGLERPAPLRVEVNGRLQLESRTSGRRETLHFEAAGTASRLLDVRVGIDPPETGPRPRLLLHAARTLPRTDSAGHGGAALDLASLGDTDPALEYGIWAAETWKDGRKGRWTAGEASLRMRRDPGQQRLRLDLTSARSVSGRVEVNGQPVGELSLEAGRRAVAFGLPGAQGGPLTVRIFVDDPRRPPGDERVLGVFLHRVELLP
jgi:lysophospholipase L1-like esterase